MTADGTRLRSSPHFSPVQRQISSHFPVTVSLLSPRASFPWPDPKEVVALVEEDTDSRIRWESFQLPVDHGTGIVGRSPHRVLEVGHSQREPRNFLDQVVLGNSPRGTRQKSPRRSPMSKQRDKLIQEYATALQSTGMNQDAINRSLAGDNNEILSRAEDGYSPAFHKTLDRSPYYQSIRDSSASTPSRQKTPSRSPSTGSRGSQATQDNSRTSASSRTRSHEAREITPDNFQNSLRGQTKTLSRASSSEQSFGARPRVRNSTTPQRVPPGKQDRRPGTRAAPPPRIIPFVTPARRVMP